MINENKKKVSRLSVVQPDPVDLHVGARLKLRRNLTGMSQEYLGNASGLTFQQIQKYERGVNRISASRLYRLAQILSVPVSYFFDEMPGIEQPLPALGPGFAEDGQMPLEDAPASVEMLQKRETMELIRAYYRVTDPKQRKKINELLKSMAG